MTKMVSHILGREVEKYQIYTTHPIKLMKPKTHKHICNKQIVLQLVKFRDSEEKKTQVSSVLLVQHSQRQGEIRVKISPSSLNLTPNCFQGQY